MRDLIIVGKGPAGVSAALYAKRAGLDVMVLGKDLGALQKAEKIENYFGLESPLSGEELCERGYAQLQRLGVEILTDEVVDLGYLTGYQVTGRKGIYESRALLIATGAKREIPRIAGLEEKMGSGVSACAICDGFFFRNKAVGVVGSGPYALHEAEVLLPLASSVRLFTEGKPLTADFPKEIRIIDRPIKSLYGENVLEGLHMQEGEDVPLSGLFLALGTAGAGELAQKLGAEVRGNDIVVDANMATALPGLYAAGDCTGGLKQVATAVAQGAQAALSIIKWIREQ